MKSKPALTAGCLGALAAWLATGAGVAQAADDAGTEATVRRVEFTGRPPFRREVVREPAESADFARFEESARLDTPEAGETIVVVDWTGKPPFRRERVTVTEENAVDFARFEEAPAEETTPARRHGPPGKGFRR